MDFVAIVSREFCVKSRANLAGCNASGGPVVTVTGCAAVAADNPSHGGIRRGMRAALRADALNKS